MEQVSFLVQQENHFQGRKWEVILSLAIVSPNRISGKPYLFYKGMKPYSTKEEQYRHPESSRLDLRENKACSLYLFDLNFISVV